MAVVEAPSSFEIAVRVLILNWKDRTHPLAGGAEEYTQQVARRLVELGHSVTLFTAAVDGQPESEVIDGYRVIRRGGRFAVYSEAKRYWRSSGVGQFDVVIDECNTRPFLTPRYVREVPVVGLIHQVAKEVWRYEMPLPVAIPGRYILEPKWLREYRSVPVMTISESSAESLHSYGIRNTFVLPIGAEDVVRPEVQTCEHPTMIFLGRLSRNKRPDHAIRAFDLVRQAVPEARLWVLGDGPMRVGLQKSLPAGCELLGRVSFDERQRRLARAHVLIATSVREGWGLNVSEAAAVGTPSIGYRVDGLRDSIPASGGLLVDPDPSALANGVVSFFNGAISLAPHVSTVSWDAVGDAVESFLSDVVGAFEPS